jgi:tRNA(Arg) A34 adenosine deaminase TadA
VEARRDPSAHAEMLALRAAAAATGDKLLPEATLWVTLEPCAMCAAAASFFRVKRVAFGAYDPKGGGVEHGARFFAQPTCHHAPEVVGGLREGEAAELLRAFFAQLRS